MVEHVRVARLLAACLAFAAAGTACTPARTQSPSLMARCARLYALWERYNQDPVFLYGQKARAELALYSCRNGNYEAGIQELEKMLQRGGISLALPRPLIAPNNTIYDSAVLRCVAVRLRACDDHFTRSRLPYYLRWVLQRRGPS